MENYILLKILSFIAALLVLFYVLIRIMKKNGLHHHKNSDLIKVLQHKRIDTKTSLCLIKIQGQCYLLASSSESIDLREIRPISDIKLQE